MKKTIFLIMLIASVSALFSQNQGNIWYFGNYAGLDFNGGEPKALTDSKLSTHEGCASIADEDGKLLFYTDGVYVWNKNHEVMPNGDGLKGNSSSTQSGVIIPKPNSKEIYYVFTVAEQASTDGFHYSIVDLTKENGLGDVTQKNIRLLDTVTEKITAVRHRNNKSVWIITHKWESNEFCAYLLSDDGLNSEPVTTAIGTVHKGKTPNTIGYLKASPDGSMLGVNIRSMYICEIFDFDNETGKLSNPISLQLEIGYYMYGLEFSPNNSLLYVSIENKGKIYQYNLQAGSEEKIKNSQTLIYDNNGSNFGGALQLGPDKKIYFSNFGKEYLSAICKPDLIGEDCEFVEEAVSLDERVASFGLPTFYQSYFDITDFKEEEEIIYFDENKEVKVGETIILKNILFDFNSSKLQASSNTELDKVVKLLNDNLEFNIVISGHTDNVGNMSKNIVLSEQRAKSVGDYFISKGISETRIEYKGFGSSKPIASNATNEGRQQNRRVEFEIVK